MKLAIGSFFVTMIGLFLLIALLGSATSRSAPVSPEFLGSSGTGQAQTGAPHADLGQLGLGARPTADLGQLGGGVPPHLIPPACSGPCPTLTPNHRLITPKLVVRGIATTYGPGYDGYLAWPDGPGWRLRICGPAACVTKVSNDAGPSLAGQRAGRVVDLDVPTFEQVSGQPWRRGICSVTVQVMGRG